MSGSRAGSYRPNRFTAAEVRAFWDAVADEYVHEAAALRETHFQRFERAFTYFELRDGMAVLNIWSRNGEAIDYFRRRTPRLRLVNAEVSPRLIEVARQRYPTEEFIQTDLTALPFRDRQFDLVLSLETLEHAPVPLRFLQELHRVLKPGGQLVLSCPPATAEPLLRLYELLFHNHGEGPHRFLASSEVKRLLRWAGFALRRHAPTLFVPVGPRWLRRCDPLIERLLGRTPLAELGIRQFYLAEKPTAARSDRHAPWRDLFRRVIRPGLCTRCGTCAGVCPAGALEFADLDGHCLPAAIRPDACSACGLCLAACPGQRVSFAELHRSVGEVPLNDPALGPIRRIRIARAADPPGRLAGASGGAVTALLCDLLQRRQITGAVVLDSHPERPWRPWPKIARTREETIHAAQSKYCVTPTNVWLRNRRDASDRLAVVALPCQVHALRKLQQHGHPAVKRAVLIIGLYCGNQLYFDATRSFLHRHGVEDLRQVAAIRYRDGTWPGSVRCLLSDGRSFAVPKVHFNQLISPYIVPRCLLCTDLANEGADLSVGDAWDRRRERTGDGRSVVITRTARGEAAVAAAIAGGTLEAVEIDVAEARRMHAHGLDLKKLGAPLRIERRRRKHLPTPEYDPPTPRVPLRRRLAESLVDAHFALCCTRPACWLIDLLPLSVVGRLYDSARIVWRTRAAEATYPQASQAAEATAAKPRQQVAAGVSLQEEEAPKRESSREAPTATTHRDPSRLKGPSDSFQLRPGSCEGDAAGLPPAVRNRKANPHRARFRPSRLSAVSAAWHFICLPLRMVASPQRLRRLGLRSMEDERLEAVLPHCRGRLLDVGCGPGNELVRRYDGPGIGVDVAPWPGIDLLCDTRRMPFEDGSFDTITIVAAFNHIPDRAAVLRECRRLLASHGRLIITMIGPVVGYIRHRLIAGWDPDQLHRQHQPGELPGMSNRHIRRLLEEARFEIELHRRFVLGLNNLFVARPNRQQPADSNGAVGVVASQTVTLTTVARKRGCNNRSGGDQAPSAEDTTTMR